MESGPSYRPCRGDLQRWASTSLPYSRPDERLRLPPPSSFLTHADRSGLQSRSSFPAREPPMHTRAQPPTSSWADDMVQPQDEEAEIEMSRPRAFEREQRMRLYAAGDDQLEVHPRPAFHASANRGDFGSLASRNSSHSDVRGDKLAPIARQEHEDAAAFSHHSGRSSSGLVSPSTPSMRSHRRAESSTSAQSSYESLHMHDGHHPRRAYESVARPGSPVLMDDHSRLRDVATRALHRPPLSLSVHHPGHDDGRVRPPTFYDQHGRRVPTASEAYRENSYQDVDVHNREFRRSRATSDAYRDSAQSAGLPRSPTPGAHIRDDSFQPSRAHRDYHHDHTAPPAFPPSGAFLSDVGPERSPGMAPAGRGSVPIRAADGREATLHHTMRGLNSTSTPAPAYAQAGMMPPTPHGMNPISWQACPMFATAPPPPIPLPVSGLHALAGPSQSSNVGETRPKRLRISRACDECRRRKTRCDVVGAFPGEDGYRDPSASMRAADDDPALKNYEGDMLIIQPCTNCRRSGVECMYSKRPLKRGPSKGYIKDLERRLNSLETHMVAGSSTSGEGAKTDEKPEARILRLETALASAEGNPSPELKESLPDHDHHPDGSASQEDERHSCMDESVELASMPATPEQQSAKQPFVEEQERGRSAQRLQAQETGLAAHAQDDVQEEDEADVQRQRGPANRPVPGPSRSRPTMPFGTVGSIKSAFYNTDLQGTFAILASADEAHSVAGLDDRILLRGIRLVIDGIEDPTTRVVRPTTTASRSRSKNSPFNTGSVTSSAIETRKLHSSRVAQLVGQVSAGLYAGDGNSSTLRAGTSPQAFRAARGLASRRAALEADTLILCYLDALRHAQANPSALAAAISKLGSGVQNEQPATLRRRTVLYMMDRWHSAAFNTPHLLNGRLVPENLQHNVLCSSLGQLDSALGNAPSEVLRAAIMFGHLQDMALTSAWKHVSCADLESIIHSAGDAFGAPAGGTDEDEQLRRQLEAAVRVYHALNTLPLATEATVKDVARLFELAEKVVVDGSVKTPLSVKSKLLRSAIGPHTVAIVLLAMTWTLRIIASLTSQMYADAAKHTDDGDRQEPGTSRSAQAMDRDGRGPASPDLAALQPLEHYRRKTQDYVRMLGPLCLFSGGAPDGPGSFKPLYACCALYAHMTVTYSSKLGRLNRPLSDESPARDSYEILVRDVDEFAEMATEMGPLGYVLASTDAREAWSLLET